MATNEIATKHRLLVADVSRGLAIFLVVWGHFAIQVFQNYMDAQNMFVVRFIYSFHMPLLMLISGFFFYRSNNTKSFRMKVKKSIVSLLLPLMLWGSVGVIIIYGYLKSIQGKTDFSASDALTRLAWEYWFLWALLFYQLTMAVIRKIPLIGLRVLLYLFSPFVVFMLTPLKWILLTEYPLFLLGYFFAYIEDKKRISEWIKFAFGLGSCVIFGVIYLKYTKMPYVKNQEIFELVRAIKPFLMNEISFGYVSGGLVRYLLFLLLGITGSSSVIFLVWVICHMKKGAKLLERIGEIGQFSMHIYLFQRIIIEFLFGFSYGALWASKFKTYMIEHTVFVSIFILGIASALFVILIVFLCKKITNRRISTLLFGR